jgi:ferrous iron transport protein B
MSESQGAAPLKIALIGNPNAGKTALFNALTGTRQHTGNYPGVTVERKSGVLALPDGTLAQLIDLPGIYSLAAASPDEAITRAVLLGEQTGEAVPDVVVLVVDAGNLAQHLKLALEVRKIGVRLVLALNMVDLAKRDGLELSAPHLAEALGVAVVETVAVRKRGLEPLKAAIVAAAGAPAPALLCIEPSAAKARELAKIAVVSETVTREWTRKIDSIVLHPLYGVLLFFALLFLMFQAVFSLAQVPMDAISAAIAALKGVMTHALPDTLWRSALRDGLITGVGAVISFTPQILILFAFILTLEASGYMTRAAFLMDRVMAKVGLSGHAAIPLLSSFACAVPGIMATRTIEDERDRLTTMLIAPLMTCSARLPVYVVIISAFIPAKRVGVLGLQGLVLFGLYVSGSVFALLVAWLLRHSVARGKSLGLLIEMPRYQWPHVRDIALGLWGRLRTFLKRAGTLIAATAMVLWLLMSFPRALPQQSQYDVSYAGQMATGVVPLFKPIGFNRQIVMALIPAMAAREAAVSGLASAYAVENAEDGAGLGERLRHEWSLATALAFLAWFVFAPQCMSTIAVLRRETHGWKWPSFALLYLFVLAYIAAGLTYWLACAAGLG